MIKNIFVISLLSISSFYCGFSKKIETSHKQTVINDKLYSIPFEANLIKIEINNIPNELITGIKYKKEIINKFSDSCELIIGMDANYQMEIGNIEYSENKFKLEKAKFLKLHVHSPIRVFGFEPENGKRYKFNLIYTIKDEDSIEFNYLEARELK
jgi:hypothetical protein